MPPDLGYNGLMGGAWRAVIVMFITTSAAGCLLSTQAGPENDAGLDASVAPPPDACVPTTCEAGGAECGSIDDGCGGTLSCGGCAAPKLCGAITDNVCDCGWVDEDVAPGDAPTSLEVEPSGRVHLVFSDDAGLRYGNRSVDGQWQFEYIAMGDLGSPDLTLSMAGVHVSYRDATNDRLYYAFRPLQGTWTSTDVAPADYLHTAIAVDGGGSVHILYTQWSSIRYAYLASGGTWQLEEITASHVAGRPAMTLAPDGIHVAYSTFFTDDLFHAQRPVETGVWERELVDGPDGSHGVSTIGVDLAGDVFVAYRKRSGATETRLAHLRPGGWDIRTLYFESSQSRDFSGDSFIVDSVGRFHSVYTSYDRFVGGSLYYAWEPGGGDDQQPWPAQSVDSSGSTARLTQGSDGRLHVGYLDREQSGAHEVKYAVFECNDR